MNQEPLDIERHSRPFDLAGIMAAGILSGAVVGGATNAINGLISPAYFIWIMGWHGVEDVWRASVAQGIFEGCVFGFGLSLILTIATAIITETSCTFGFAFKHLCGIVGAALGCWVLGGLAAMGLAALSPEFYRSAFIGVPEEFGDMIAYAWVGGSIWGVQFGGLACVVIGLIFLRANWRHHVRRAGSSDAE